MRCQVRVHDEEGERIAARFHAARHPERIRELGLGVHRDESAEGRCTGPGVKLRDGPVIQPAERRDHDLFHLGGPGGIPGDRSRGAGQPHQAAPPQLAPARRTAVLGDRGERPGGPVQICIQVRDRRNHRLPCQADSLRGPQGGNQRPAVLVVSSFYLIGWWLLGSVRDDPVA